MSDVDERMIRFHLAMERQERERRAHARDTGDRSAPYLVGAGLLGIAGIILGTHLGNDAVTGVGAAAIVIALFVASATGDKPPSHLGAVRQASMQVLAVSCPECGAKIGQRCTLPAFDVRVCHQERGRSYAEAEMRVFAALQTDT